MLVSDIFNRVIHRSGQYLLHTNNVEMKIDAFRLLVEDALAMYNKASPYDKEIIVDALEPRSVEIEADPILKRVPDWVAKATPILSGHSRLPYTNTHFGFSNAFNNVYGGNVSQPIEAVFKYRKPTLTVNISAQWEVIAVWNHMVERVEGTRESREYEIRTITIEDNVFLDIVKSLFLIGIGRSRRAFTMGDLPIAMDADQLVSDGESALERAKEELGTVQKFYLGI